ncbi:winged helix-turn-helix domain-containing protein [Phytomonospora sp. NPDC050363]|uniref:winged helix-turn-helix domain-containing protein n=1 Tax=Phytomonospora sp. NPDC050363 TaxID=3155642 RepID=UPI0033F9F902
MTIQLDHPPTTRLPVPATAPAPTAPPVTAPAPLAPTTLSPPPPPAPRTVPRPAPPGLTVTIELSAPDSALNEELLAALDAAREHIAHLGAVTVTVRAAEPPATALVQAPAVDPADHVHIYPDSRVVRLGGDELPLSRLEFDLLLFLAEHPGQVFSRSRLLEAVWNDAHVGRRTIDVHIRRLRAKIDDRFPLVTTIRGVGYRFDGRGRVSVTRS